MSSHPWEWDMEAEPFFAAAKAGDIGAILPLLPTATAADISEALALAASAQKTAVIELLLSADVPGVSAHKALFHAALTGDVALTERLIPFTPDESRRIDLAGSLAANGQLDTLSALMRSIVNDADVGVGYKTATGRVAAQAASAGRIEVIRYMLERFDMKPDAYAILHAAAASNRLDVLGTLLSIPDLVSEPQIEQLFRSLFALPPYKTPTPALHLLKDSGKIPHHAWPQALDTVAVFGKKDGLDFIVENTPGPISAEAIDDAVKKVALRESSDAMQIMAALLQHASNIENTVRSASPNANPAMMGLLYAEQDRRALAQAAQTTPSPASPRQGLPSQTSPRPRAPL